MELLMEIEADRHKDMDRWTDSQCSQIIMHYMCVLSQPGERERGRETETETERSMDRQSVWSDKRVLHACSVPAGI